MNSSGTNKRITSSEWKYTGTKINVPDGWNAIIIARCGWNKGQPVGVVISGSDTQCNTLSVTEVSGDGFTSHAVIATYFGSTGTYYLWSRHKHLSEDELTNENMYALIFKAK